MGGATPLLPRVPSGRGPEKILPSSYLGPQRIISLSTFSDYNNAFSYYLTRSTRPLCPNTVL